MPITHSRPRSRLALLAAGDWARGPRALETLDLIG